MLQKTIKGVLLCAVIVATSACGTKNSEPESAYNANSARIIRPYYAGVAPSPTLAQNPPHQVTKNSTTSGPSTRTITNSDSTGAYKNGTFMVMPAPAVTATNEAYAEARELKLKMRELAAQLVVDLPASLSSSIGVPTSFVTLDNFSRSSSFGRFISEQMLYEFNQRGVSTHEYRMNNVLRIERNGEFILTRKNKNISLNKNSFYLVGTYYTDGSSVFVNGRLIQSDGRILRTGQIIFPMTGVAYHMLGNSGGSFDESSINIRASVGTAPGRNNSSNQIATTPFDSGFDVH